MRVLVTGISGYIGSKLVPRLVRGGHDVRGFSRRPLQMSGVPVIRGDAVTGQGLAEALDGVEVAYFLIHSMEPSHDGPFAARELAAATNFARAAAAAGTPRIIYLGGLIPEGGPASPHLASRLAVEEVLLKAAPCAAAFRASIVIGASSSSFRLLVRLIERMPVLAVPAWGRHRTNPIDERDIVEILAAAATNDSVCGRSWGVGGPETVSYRELINRIREHMLVSRPTVSLRRLTVTPIASRVAAMIAGADWELVGPLMESLDRDLLVTENTAVELLGVRLHSLDAAIERGLREYEELEPLAAR